MNQCFCLIHQVISLNVEAGDLLPKLKATRINKSESEIKHGIETELNSSQEKIAPNHIFQVPAPVKKASLQQKKSQEITSQQQRVPLQLRPPFYPDQRNQQQFIQQKQGSPDYENEYREVRPYQFRPQPIVELSNSNHSMPLQGHQTQESKLFQLKQNIHSMQIHQQEILSAIYSYARPETILSLLKTDTGRYHINLVLDNDGNSVLHWAAALGRFELVNVLLQYNDSCIISNNYQQSPLFYATCKQDNYSSQNFKQMLKIFESCVFTFDYRGRSFIHNIVASCSDARVLAARYYLDCTSEWIDGQLDSWIEYNNREDSDETDISRPLSDKEISDLINHCDNDGNTALHLAISIGEVYLVKILVSLGCSIDIRNKNGETSSLLMSENSLFTDIFSSIKSEGFENGELVRKSMNKNDPKRDSRVI